jgi:hypothetical protein
MRVLKTGSYGSREILKNRTKPRISDLRDLRDVGRSLKDNVCISLSLKLVDVIRSRGELY